MRLVEQMRGETSSGEHLRPVGGPLTPRQWQVLDLLCEGRTTEEIAASLTVSSETVRSHVQGIFRRLNVRSREDAAFFVRWIERLETAARASPMWITPDEQAAVLRTFASARSAFERISQ